MSESVKPELPDISVRPVTNGYVITVGIFRPGDYVSNGETYVARSMAELTRVLKHIAVKDKLKTVQP